jgi:hypothetical protein
LFEHFTNGRQGRKPDIGRFVEALVPAVWVKSRTFLHAILRQVMKEGSAMEAMLNHEAAE